MMVTAEARERRDELIEHYHDEFCRILGLLKFDKPIPTLDDLNREIARFGFFGNSVFRLSKKMSFNSYHCSEVLLCTCFVPYSFVDLAKCDDLTELFGESEKAKEFTRRLYQNKDYQTLVRREMPRFLNLRFLDLE
jgi:hypothetical protein